MGWCILEIVWVVYLAPKDNDLEVEPDSICKLLDEFWNFKLSENDAVNLTWYVQVSQEFLPEKRPSPHTTSSPGHPQHQTQLHVTQ